MVREKKICQNVKYKLCDTYIYVSVNSVTCFYKLYITCINKHTIINMLSLGYLF